MQSTTDEVRIQASDSITLNAGQSQIELKGGNITFTCPGTWTVKGAMHDWAGGGSGSVGLMALPSGASTRVPEPSLKPDLEAPVYSEALGFTEYPNEWLPFGDAKSVAVYEEGKPVGQLSAGPADEFTASLITDQAKQVRYALNVRHGWTVEQGVEVVEWGDGAWKGEDMGEDSDE